MNPGCVRYLRRLHHPEAMKRTVEAVAAAVRDLAPDAIAFRGMSGASCAYPVSFLTGIPVLNVRKASDGYCHGQKVEGPADCRKIISKYVIIDDLIASGNTMRAIIEGLEDYDIPASSCIGILLYCVPEQYEFTYRKGDDGMAHTIPIYAVSTPFPECDDDASS